MDVILGIDTSCYTTSVAVADVYTGECIHYETLMLLPEKGEKGLRQSTALFFHIKNLPEVMHKLFKNQNYNVVGVCVSAKPRPVDGSYMPVFEGGVTVAKSIAVAMNVPLYETTHQENHIMAASNGVFKRDFYALHLSGGTTELLYVRPHESSFDIDIVSKTTDISFGKLIDRVGVDMGLDFPCGKALEKLAYEGNNVFKIPIKLYNGEISLSGAEKKFTDALKDYSKEDIAASLFDYCGKLLAEWVGLNAVNCEDVLFAGGVASNSIIKKIIASSPKMKNLRTYFAEPDLCRDNAVGTSMIGVKKYRTEHNL